MQAEHKLTSDGIVGPITLSALLKLSTEQLLEGQDLHNKYYLVSLFAKEALLSSKYITELLFIYNLMIGSVNWEN